VRNRLSFSRVLVACVVLGIPAAALYGGPTPGLWKTGDGDEEFFVTSDGAHVEKFAITLTVTGCGTYKITHMNVVPIIDNAFSFAGPFYAQGTFSSDTSASATCGLDHYDITGCGVVSGGPWTEDVVCSGCIPAPTYTPAHSTPTPTHTPVPGSFLDVHTSSGSPAAGDPFSVRVNVQPIEQAFDAWGVIFGPAGAIHSFVLNNPGALVPGAVPLATNVPRLGTAYDGSLLDLPAIPQGVQGTYRIIVGLVPAGVPPTDAGSAIPGYVDTENVTVR